jgi:hypothetical protein
MGAPFGNQNASKKNRLLREGLKRELIQNPEYVLEINKILLESARKGEQWAQQMVRDQTDGKVPQPVVGDDEEPPIQVEGFIRLRKPEGGGQTE